MFKQVLHSIRVLDLAPAWSAYAARLLGDLGAEVIKIEPPEGDPLRGKPDFERLNANKYGCTLDVSVDSGLSRLEALASLSDVIIAPPDLVDLHVLIATRPSLIAVSLPADATAEQSIAAAAGAGVALWDRRRSGEGSRVDVAASHAERQVLQKTQPRTEPVSTSHGVVSLESSPWHLSESPTHVRLPAPGPGEHNDYVFASLLAEERASA
jgi:crotonobetainyl-CoA:carnitine CoA-transferase CaiB-like acyl-CoA transferase